MYLGCKRTTVTVHCDWCRAKMHTELLLYWAVRSALVCGRLLITLTAGGETFALVVSLVRINATQLVWCWWFT